MSVHKANVVALVSLWRKRTHKPYKTVVIEVNAALPTRFTANMFRSRYRKSDRAGTYTATEVFAVFSAFHRVEPSRFASTALELVLLSFWTQTGRTLLRMGMSFFEEDDLKTALSWYVYDSPSEFNYFDDEQRNVAYQQLNAHRVQTQGTGRQPALPNSATVLRPDATTVTTVTHNFKNGWPIEFPRQPLPEQECLNTAQLYIHKGQFDAALHLLKPLITPHRAVKKDKRRYTVEAYSLMAVAELEQGNSGSALEYLAQAETLAEHTDRALLAKLKANIGQAYTQLGQYSVARRHLREGYAIASEYNDQIVMLYTKTGMGICAAELVNNPLALADYRDALIIARRNHFPKREAYLQLNLGVLQFQQSNFVQATEQFEKTAQYVSQGSPPLLQGHLRWMQTVVELAMYQNPRSVLKQLREVETIAQSFGLGWLRISVQISQATALLMMGKLEAAMQAFEIGFCDANRISSSMLMDQALSGWSLTYLMMNFPAGIPYSEGVALWLGDHLPLVFRSGMRRIKSAQGNHLTQAMHSFQLIVGENVRAFPVAQILQDIFTASHD